MDVSCSILRETKVGVEVRAHRRHPDPSISTLANGLLKRWKSLFSSTAPLAASAKANKQAQRRGAPAHAHAHITAAVSSSSAEAAEAASEAIAVRDSAATLQVRQRAVEGFAAVLRRVDKPVGKADGKSVRNAKGGQPGNIGESSDPLEFPLGCPLSSPAELNRIAQEIEQEAYVEGEGDTDSYRSKVR